MEKLNVAIADDNVRMADILGPMIEEDKDLTLVGKSTQGRRNLQHHQRKRTGCWCSGYYMPKMDGLTVMEHCSHDRSVKKPAGVYCSIGGGTGKNHRRGVQSWRILYMLKPFDKQVL